jgi:hypothetical protein
MLGCIQSHSSRYTPVARATAAKAAAAAVVEVVVVAVVVVVVVVVLVVVVVGVVVVIVKSDRIHLYRLLNTFHVSRVHTSCLFVTHEVVSQSSVIVRACIFEGKLRRLLAILVHYILIQVASRLQLQEKSGMQSSVFTPTAWN